MMDPGLRKVIQNKKDVLSGKINLSGLKPYLEKYQIFTNSMLEDLLDVNSECDLFVELTTRGPDALCKFRKALKEAGYFEAVEILESRPLVTLPKRLRYKMNSKPLGYCLILNNVDFKSMEYRYGSDQDSKNLEHLFQTLGYEVTVKNNLTADNMIIKLQKFKDQNRWSDVDSCVLIILSHGDNINNLDVIYGTDSKFIKKMKIYEMFDNINCEPLQHKPKMFFFQACRGDEEDDGVYVTESTDAAKKIKIPSMSNLLVAHSALPNHQSYRDHEKGSWFCQDLIQVFQEDYFTQDLETMLKRVAHKLESRVSVKHKKQVLHVDNFGFKAAVYFCTDNIPHYYDIWNPKDM